MNHFVRMFACKSVLVALFLKTNPKILKIQDKIFCNDEIQFSQSQWIFRSKYSLQISQSKYAPQKIYG